MIKVLLLLTVSCAVFGTAKAADCSTYASELATMRVADQSLREYLIENEQPSQRLGKAAEVIDRTNTRRMKSLLKQCGWPMTSKYGKDASYNAWLLIQHADEDRPFQRKALTRLKQAVEAGGGSSWRRACVSQRSIGTRRGTASTLRNPVRRRRKLQDDAGAYRQS
jgi:hypothetical protein